MANLLDMCSFAVIYEASTRYDLCSELVKPVSDSCLSNKRSSLPMHEARITDQSSICRVKSNQNAPTPRIEHLTDIKESISFE
jgi:hypothetical protein